LFLIIHLKSICQFSALFYGGFSKIGTPVPSLVTEEVTIFYVFCSQESYPKSVLLIIEFSNPFHQ
jgi:hypothetical protein